MGNTLDQHRAAIGEFAGGAVGILAGIDKCVPTSTDDYWDKYYSTHVVLDSFLLDYR